MHFETRDYITIAGIIVAAVVSLLLGYWHRKQMRQIEAYKADPSVGLMPPPSPMRLFFRRYSFLIYAVFWTGTLLWDATSSEPITRRSIVLIAVDVGMIVFSVLIWLAFTLAMYTMETDRAILGIISGHFEIISKHFELTRGLVETNKATIDVLRQSQEEAKPE